MISIAVRAAERCRVAFSEAVQLWFHSSNCILPLRLPLRKRDWRDLEEHRQRAMNLLAYLFLSCDVFIADCSHARGKNLYKNTNGHMIFWAVCPLLEKAGLPPCKGATKDSYCAQLWSPLDKHVNKSFKRTIFSNMDNIIWRTLIWT